MKPSTLRNAPKVVYESCSSADYSNNSPNPKRLTLKSKGFIKKTIFVNWACMFAGFVPIITVPLWRTIETNSSFIVGFLSSPDIIFVGIALWIAYLGSLVLNGIKVKAELLLLNEVGILIGVIVFSLETIAEEKDLLNSNVGLFIFFNVVFCTLQFALSTVAGIVTNETVNISEGEKSNK